MDNKDLLALYFSEYKKAFFEKARLLHSNIRNQDRDSSPDSFNTIYTGLSLFLNINEKQIEKSITDGNEDYSIDAIYIPNNESIHRNVAVFDFKGNGSLDYEEIKKFLGYVEKYILEGEDLPLKGNTQLIDKLKELHAFLKSNPNVKVDIVVYRESQKNDVLIKSEENRLQYIKLKYDRIGDIKVIGYKDVLDLVASKLWYEGNIYSRNYSVFNLKIANKDFISPYENLLIGTVTLYDLLSFIKVIDDYNGTITPNRKYDIFNLNVRKKTDKSLPIRKGIIHTVENSPENFLSYNNGITITCEKFSLNDSLINFEQPQIVNGCQTISGLFEYYSKSLNDYSSILNMEECVFRNKDDIINCIRGIENLKRARIYVKIVIAPQLSEEPKKISHFANSQTEVNYRDLVSNNLEQLIIGNFLSINGINYFRKDGQFFDNDKKLISISQLYKFMYSYILLDPSKGKNDMKIVFEDDSIYSRLFPGVFSLDDLVRIANLYETVGKYRKRNGINQYYVDYIVFGLFLIYKEGLVATQVQPNTIKLILDKILEEKSGKKIANFDSYDYMKYFQRLPGSVLNNLFIEQLQSKYNFVLDKNKFDDFINSLKKRRIEERNERMKKYILYKHYSLEKLNNYLKEREETGKKFKNIIWIIIDIVSDNNGTINIEDLTSILHRIHKYNPTYVVDIINKNTDKIISKDGLLSIAQTT